MRALGRLMPRCDVHGSLLYCVCGDGSCSRHSGASPTSHSLTPRAAAELKVGASVASLLINFSSHG